VKINKQEEIDVDTAADETEAVAAAADETETAAAWAEWLRTALLLIELRRRCCLVAEDCSAPEAGCGLWPLVLLVALLDCWTAELCFRGGDDATVW
jgi:hypothetical protein